MAILTKNFKQLSKANVGEAGGKGASLGEMTQAGIPVPPGFVVLSESFEQFLTETDLNVEIDAILHKVNHKEIHTVENASEEIKALILDAKMPKDIATDIKKQFKSLGAKYVAVRSSATAEDSSSAAWAGQLESYLNTTEKELLKNVQRCWASLFTPRAIFYRFEKGLHGTKISVAVVVQKMIQSEISGIAFSVHPVTQDYNQLIIEAGYGLGEAIVSGSITPDSYVVEKDKYSIIDINIADQIRALVKSKTDNEWVDISNGDKQKLTDTQILELSKLIVRIEDHYGFPCDIEWAFEKNKFYIVQSRPITTLTENNGEVKKKEKNPLVNKTDHDGKKKISSDRFVKAYTRDFSVIKDNEPILFKKTYSRDTSLFMQGLWAKGLINLTKQKLGWNNPYLPLVAHFVNDGVVEIWEHKPAIQWFLDKLLQENKNGTIFFKKLLKEYEQLLSQLKKFYKNGISNKKDLKAYSDLIYEAALDMTLFFYAGVDERTPEAVKKICVQARKAGDFFADNDLFIKKTIAMINKISEEYANFVLPEEVFDLPKVSVLNERVKNFLLIDGTISHLGSIESFVNKNPNYVFEQPEIQTELKEVKGLAAYKGVVQGVVRIVKKQSELNKVRVGDILVSPMTTPDFLPAMQNAAAFVTDEGGVTCHAAIVAREMKKPCIIGTKIATQVLKDGDLIEVDADNGIVRRVSQTEQSLYIKSYARDFCLPIIQMWCRAETTNPRQWTDKVNPKLPFEIFIRENGLVTDYLDESGMDWIKNELKRLIKKDKNYVKKLVKEFTTRAKVLKPIWEKQAALNHKQLVDYFRRQEDIWAWFEAVWWTMEMVPENSEAFRLVKHARVSTENMVPYGDILVRKSLRKLFPKLGKYSAVLTIEEITSKQLPALSELKIRMEKYSFTYASLFVGEGVSEMESRFGINIQTQAAHNNSVTEFSGQVAYPGKVTGVVRRLMSRDNVADLKVGEILVSPMTMPDYLPAMQKSAAFITDEGGVTSHAAIIARELKKPCIIGTKIATEVLKDSDLVEVDADKGVVRILNDQGASSQLNVADWQIVITRNMSFWHQWMSNRGHFNHSKDFGVQAPNRQLSMTFNGTRSCILTKPEYMAEYAKAILEAIDSPAKVEKLKKYYHQYASEMLESVRRCDKNLNVKTWDNFVQKYTRMTAGLFLTSVVGRAGMTKLSELLTKKGYPEKDLPEIIGIITYPKKHTPLFSSQLSLMEIGKTVQKNKLSKAQINKLLQKWLDNYGVIPVNFCDNPWTLADAQKQLADMLKKDCAKEIKRSETAHAGKLKEQKRLLKKMNDKDISAYAYALAEGTSLNEFRKNMFSRTSLAYRGIFKRIAKMGGSDNWRDCFFLTSDEMHGLLEGIKINISELVEKRRVVGFYTDESGNHFIEGDKLKEFADMIESAHGKSQAPVTDTMVKGFTANKGKVTGVARVVLSSADFHKVNPGDILVATMTSVDFVPIMERAAAFVTNEGGITSHASIVAREMNKPCVIGTQTATRVIRDGDLVEVDANKGTVKILRK